VKTAGVGGAVSEAAATDPIPRHPDPATFLVVAVVAFSTLALQVLLTRIFAALVFYHFSFLAISLALLGTGAGGLYVSLRQPPPNRFALRVLLSGWAAVLAVTLTLVPVVIVRLNFDYSDGLSPHFVFAMTVACVVSALPSFAAGVVIAMAIRAHAEVVGRIYAVDLVAAGLGALAVVPAIWMINPPHLVVALGLLAAVTAVVIGPDLRARRWAGLAGVVPVAVLIAAPLTSIITVPVPGLDLAGTIRSEVWTPLSRVIGVIPGQTNSFGLVFYDRVSAPVLNYAPGQPSPDWTSLHLGPQTIPSVLGHTGKSLVIGGGGGRDIHNLRSSGVDDIDVIELNEGIRQIVDDKMSVFSGSPYSMPGVHTTIGDGRSILARRGLYDQIQISFTDSLSAGGAAAYALSENNLYTVEAFQEYLDHLAPGGILAVTRRYQLVGDEALRATVLALETLKRNGVEHPEQQVVVVLGRDIFDALFGTILVKNEPFTADELTQIKKLAAERGEGVAFAPGGPYQLEWADLAAAASPSAFCHSYKLDVCAPTDDRPFFFNMKRLSDVGKQMKGYSYAVDPVLILFLTFAVITVLSVLGYVVPLLLARHVQRPPPGALAYFVLIGLGYLLVEAVFIQRFVLMLGYPTYSLSVVLAALLAFTGLGSWLSTKWRDERRGLNLALAAATVLIAASAFFLPSLVEHMVSSPFSARVAVTVAVLAPFGLLMGMAMPIGLRRYEALHPGGVPFAWAANGFASVVAAALATVLALVFGFTVTTIVAALCYAGALAHARFGKWAPRVTA